LASHSSIQEFYTEAEVSIENPHTERSFQVHCSWTENICSYKPCKYILVSHPPIDSGILHWGRSEHWKSPHREKYSSKLFL